LEKTGRVIVGDTEDSEQTEEIRIEGASKIETVNCEPDEGIEATRPFFGIPASRRLLEDGNEKVKSRRRFQISSEIGLYLRTYRNTPASVGCHHCRLVGVNSEFIVSIINASSAMRRVHFILLSSLLTPY
jgi:hypothetical protein